MIGRTLGRYRIVERLGSGGAGTVYRAQDPRLERDVAIKVLHAHALNDEQARRRFRREARALSRLLHPNIATLFDLDADEGVDFLVLEFVSGETLAQTLSNGPLPEARARAIGAELADALDFAHEQGIVHRDLKPANVIITPRGRSKILDFGIARLLHDGDTGAGATQDATGSLIGTIQYMAPEQIENGSIDQRTDVYALGVILYEMTTGTWPYPGGALGAMLYQIVRLAPRALREVQPGLSSDLATIVHRCLEKDPSGRYATAGALARALRGDSDQGVSRAVSATSTPSLGRQPVSHAETATASPGRIRSLAVLPLQNLSGDASQEFFTDGMTDALITDLAQIGALRVISRTSSMRFKGLPKPIAEIARELRVDALVEGSVLRSGDRVRISAQLIDASSDSTIWAKSYERDITDLLALQRDVARSIAEGIRVQVTPDEQRRLTTSVTVDPRAQLAYLRGRYMWNRWDTKSLRESIGAYEEALAVDPAYARAWGGLADSYSILGQTNAMAPAEAYPRAREAAERGLALDESLAELHTSLAFVHRFYDWDWRGAEREFLRALALNPGYATARRFYAQLLSGLGRHDEAIAEAERSLELDPLSLIIHAAVGDVFFYARRYEESVTYYRRSLEMDASFEPGHTDLARSLEHLGRTDEALNEFLLVQPKENGAPRPTTGLAIYLVRAGRQEEASRVIAELLDASRNRFVSPYGIASYYAVCGDTGRAFEWLERAYAQRDGAMVWLKVHPRLDGLRSDERFRDLLSRMHLDT